MGRFCCCCCCRCWWWYCTGEFNSKSVIFWWCCTGEFEFNSNLVISSSLLSWSVGVRGEGWCVKGRKEEEGVKRGERKRQGPLVVAGGEGEGEKLRRRSGIEWRRVVQSDKKWCEVISFHHQISYYVVFASSQAHSPLDLSPTSTSPNN